MREAPCAATRQHDADAAPCQHPRDSLHIRWTRNVMMGNARMLADPSCGRAAYELSVVHEDQLGPLRRQARAPRSIQRSPAANLALRARKQQQRIGLPHTQIAPPAGPRLCHVHHVVVRGFDAMEPVAGVGGRADAPHELRATAGR